MMTIQKSLFSALLALSATAACFAQAAVSNPATTAERAVSPCTNITIQDLLPSITHATGVDRVKTTKGGAQTEYVIAMTELKGMTGAQAYFIRELQKELSGFILRRGEDFASEIIYVSASSGNSGDLDFIRQKTQALRNTIGQQIQAKGNEAVEYAFRKEMGLPTFDK